MTYRYEASWYNINPKIQALYVLALRRSLTPPRLTAGGLIELNMQSFSEVYIYLKLIFSRIIIKSLKKILVFSGNKTICFVLYSIKIDVKKKKIYIKYLYDDMIDVILLI